MNTITPTRRALLGGSVALATIGTIAAIWPAE